MNDPTEIPYHWLLDHIGSASPADRRMKLRSLHILFQQAMTGNSSFDDYELYERTCAEILRRLECDA